MAKEKQLVYKEDVIELAWLDHECEVVTLSDIEDMKPVDAVKVVHGRWVWNGENQCWICSVCGLSVLNDYRGNLAFSEYCSHCGAKMDGGINK